MSACSSSPPCWRRPTSITQCGLALPLIALYEISILAAKMVEPKPVTRGLTRCTTSAPSAPIPPPSTLRWRGAACRRVASDILGARRRAARRADRAAGEAGAAQRARRARSGQGKRTRRRHRGAGSRGDRAARRHGGPGSAAPPRWTRRSRACWKPCPTSSTPTCRTAPDETANVVLKQHGEPRDLGFEPKQHFELGEALGLMDFATAAKIAGARFIVLRGTAGAAGARAGPVHARPAHRASTAIPRWWCRSLVNDATAYGTGKLPKFADDLFRTTDGRWLIPTAEVPLTNIGDGRDPGGEGPADPHDRADRLLPQPRPARPAATPAACCASTSSARSSWCRSPIPTKATPSTSA